MSSSDRRASRITVQQLRRHLRDADEDRYRLTASAGRPPDASNRPRIFSLLLLVVVGSVIGLRTSRAPDAVAQMAVVSSAPSADISNMPASVRVQVEDVAVRQNPQPARTVRRPIATRAPAIVSARHGSRGAPRPLHPGEFGRQR